MKQNTLGPASPDNNAFLRCGLSYCKYLIKCFEQIVRFISQNAYTMIALQGKGFCKSAYEAFYLITRNLTRVAITHGCNNLYFIFFKKKVGKIFQVIGTVFVAAVTTTICYLIIT
jgi:choline transporter-like protein 2/4/5